MSAPTPSSTGSPAQRLRAAHAELLARTPESSVQPRLDPVRRALELLGDPHRAYPVVHVAGTNGKTSTARVAERLLREHGLRTGRFTSPHLHSVTERVSVDGVPLADDAFADLHEDVAPFLALVDGELRGRGQVPLTYFEALAVMAFAAFAEAPVDVAVVEVGLGGTWDATNVVESAVQVITPISLDHTELLGDTVEAIAGEKAGILRRDAIAVVGRQPEGVLPVIAERAASLRTRLVAEGEHFALAGRTVAVDGQVIAVQGLAARYEDVFLPLHGAHQAHNAALAVVAVEALLGGGERAVDGGVLEAAMADVASPGRLEVLRPSPLVLVDAAHNPAGVAGLVDALEEAFAVAYGVGVVGVLQGKDAEGVLALLEPVLAEVVVTRSSSPRAVEVEELAELAREVFGEDRVHVAERLDEALALAVDLADVGSSGEGSGGVLVTGSVTVAAEARQLLGAPAVDAPGRVRAAGGGAASGEDGDPGTEGQVEEDERDPLTILGYPLDDEGEPLEQDDLDDDGPAGGPGGAVGRPGGRGR
ncbi:bifunctional folylpolyglutamate synthase/dihydrofolate synthase [Pseudokineococcus sp. 1T1Z-3]|uniref:bifunctional folylpolyglutamate synthase/dihydrofolate synthase n=1 Tax=Pseudokineococcus sp. 1T1Z-3 TaxID=3132745 RepID=UPI0030AE2372